jgi:hypothetical protein
MARLVVPFGVSITMLILGTLENITHQMNNVDISCNLACQRADAHGIDVVR